MADQGRHPPGDKWPSQGIHVVDSGTLFTSVGRYDLQGDEAGGESYGGLAAYDAATGHCRWWYDAGGMSTDTVLPTAGVVCMHDGRRGLHAIDVATGRRWWWYDTGSELAEPLVVSADLVAGIAIGRSRLFALRP
ncbi:outer membrane protein assembly factor BamB family protein [Streptodolium elevatio]